MRKSLALLLILFFLTASCIMVAKPASSSADTAEDTWVSKAPMHEARGRLGVAVVNGKIYAIGGSSGGGEFVDTNEEYDPAMDTWTFKEPMPTPRASFGVAVYQGKIYCIGGLAGVEQNPYKRLSSGANEVYNPVTGEWETKASMPTPQEGVEASVVGGKIYVIGGNSSVNYVYDPATDSWDTKAPMPVTPHLHSGWSCTSAVVDNKIHVIGLGVNGAFHVIYDPETDSWSSGALKGTAYASAGATTGVNAPKRIYIFSADYTLWELNPPSITNLIYDPASDSWAVGASMPTGRANAGVAVVNDKLYVIGGATLEIGMNTHASAVNEQYTPVGYGTLDPSDDGVAPEVAVLSPENKTYSDTDIPLNFAVNEPVSWLRYKLDAENVTEVSGNTTLTGLALGAHNLTVYATDASGNTGTSETIYFTIAEPEPFPTALVIAAVATATAIVSVGLLIYFKKRPSSKSRASAF